MIKSYKSRLADETTDIIPLHTNNGKTGYRVVKFELLPVDADEDVESVVKVFTVDPGTPTANIDFQDATLLAAGIIRAGTGVSQPLTAITVFDNVKFNQDIYVTLKGNSYTKDVNYYLELDQMSLTEDEALVTIVKNLRNEQ